MRSLPLTLAFIGIVMAAPRPQDIDFDLAYALPNPTYTEAVGVTAQTVTYNPTTVYSAAVSQITASDTDTSDAVIATTDAALNEKRAACAAQPTGAGPVPSPDSASAFLAYPSFSAIASAAPVPSGYSQQFVNLNGSNNAYGYMGYTTLQTYDVNLCAAKCNAINGCISINIYFERDPSVDPGSGNSGCANPTSTTNIKCVFWGGPVSSSNAVNTGQWRNQFQVVIAGSNGYTNNSVAAVPGYGTAVPLGNAAINAPYDQYGYNSYMGSAIFVGAFNAELCANACTQKSQYALQHPPTDGTPVQTCQFFNTYILYINNTNNIQGQYCAMYSESWPQSYATNVGQYRGNDHFLIEYSFAYSNTTNAGSANPVNAVYQAKTDILWPGNSATPYCSSLLGYTTPVVTATTVTTFTPLATTTVTRQETDFATITNTQFTTATVTITTVLNAKRDASSESAALTAPSSTVINSTTVPALPVWTTPSAQQKRGITIPAVLTKYPASIITSGCSLAVQPVSTTSTTTSTVTSTINTVYATQQVVNTYIVTSTVIASPTTTVTATVTSTSSTPSSTCSNMYDFVISGGAADGKYLGAQAPYSSTDGISYGFVTLVSAGNAQTWTVKADGTIFGPDGQLAWTGRDNGAFYVLTMNQFSLSFYQSQYTPNSGTYYIDHLHCAVNSGNVPASVPGATGSLTCLTDAGAPMYLFWCPQNPSSLNQSPSSAEINSYGCYEVTVAAVPVSC